MNRIILYVSVATMAFIVGVAANWSINTFGCIAVDKLYADASIPSLPEANPSEVRILKSMPRGWWRCKANVVNSAHE